MVDHKTVVEGQSRPLNDEAQRQYPPRPRPMTVKRRPRRRARTCPFTTQPLGCGMVRPVVRITITPAAYAAIKASLAKGANEPPPQRDAACRLVIYVEETYVD